MLLVKPTVWTTRRKWLGNLVPALFWFPLAAIGVFTVAKNEQFLGPGLWFLAASTILGWLAVNQFGFFENRRMRLQLERILKVQDSEVKGEFIFVGFATPKYSSMLDAHEDVGFFQILPDRLVFVSETRRMELMRSDLTKIGTRANVHTVLGLGRWVSVDAEVGEKKFRLLVEPRERSTMLGSRRYGARLVTRLREWMKE
jgi:hypothetical protein